MAVRTRMILPAAFDAAATIAQSLLNVRRLRWQFALQRMKLEKEERRLMDEGAWRQMLFKQQEAQREAGRREELRRFNESLRLRQIQEQRRAQTEQREFDLDIRRAEQKDRELDLREKQLEQKKREENTPPPLPTVPRFFGETVSTLRREERVSGPQKIPEIDAEGFETTRIGFRTPEQEAMFKDIQIKNRMIRAGRPRDALDFNVDDADQVEIFRQFDERSIVVPAEPRRGEEDRGTFANKTIGLALTDKQKTAAAIRGWTPDAVREAIISTKNSEEGKGRTYRQLINKLLGDP